MEFRPSERRSLLRHFIDRCLQVVEVRVRVDRGRADPLMSECGLDDGKIGDTEQSSGERVPEHVRRQGEAAGSTRGGVEVSLDGACGDGALCWQVCESEILELKTASCGGPHPDRVDALG